MNIDYNKLQQLLTNELYNTYKSQLKSLEIKHQKNIMDSFELVENRIVSYDYKNNELTLKTYLKVKFYDYVVDKNNKVLRGNKNRRIVMTYNLTFIKSLGKVEDTCPNCGASLEGNATNNCPYCKSIIVVDAHDWVLSKKQAINQTIE